MRGQCVGGTVEKSRDDFLHGFQTRFIGAQIRVIPVRTAHFAAGDDPFLRQPVHDGQDGRVGARPRHGQLAVDVADRAFAHRPQGAHAFEFERREIENRMPRTGAAIAHTGLRVSPMGDPPCSIILFLPPAFPIGRLVRSAEGGSAASFAAASFPASSKQFNAKDSPFQSAIIRRPIAFALVGIERRPDRGHLGIQVVQIMQHQGFAEHRKLRRTKFILPVMSDQHVLHERLQRGRKSVDGVDFP